MGEEVTMYQKLMIAVILLLLTATLAMELK